MSLDFKIAFPLSGKGREGSALLRVDNGVTPGRSKYRQGNDHYSQLKA